MYVMKTVVIYTRNRNQQQQQRMPNKRNTLILKRQQQQQQQPAPIVLLTRKNRPQARRRNTQIQVQTEVLCTFLLGLQLARIINTEPTSPIYCVVYKWTIHVHSSTTITRGNHSLHKLSFLYQIQFSDHNKLRSLASPFLPWLTSAGGGVKGLCYLLTL